ncbi:ca2 :cation antiporter family [Plasmopara halstedii]|uniref:Ca2: cation antiporter family n=1 Tax=Plasmopara halstedii TaxID=4781 RepID=A0A0P1AKD8_PLAHL|nr:ca2 :cation antiporter family [Plasmopara halstedii]CEG41369.1 ca2 :cation antiporter family [Plasmopara halstedii]|eukprot:XP_024577738.1 ca2 :cation antiporter family [Plasmopara halstedii]
MTSFFIDPKDLPDDSFGLIQVLFLGVVYGYVLFNASNLISDGSELLLLVPSMAGIVGSVVLPVLGAVPDGAIVLFSGMGPDAQQQVSVGVGALAGSTIMLLTIPWALSVYAGRVNIDENGRGNYVRPKGDQHWAKLTPPGNKSLTKTGIILFDEIPSTARMMICTAMIYLILQLPALFYTGTIAKDAHADNTKVAKAERPFAIVAFVISMISFILYLYWNVQRSSEVKDDIIDEVRVAAIRDGEISLSGILAKEVAKFKTEAPDNTTPLNATREQFDRVADVIRPFFHAYDRNRDRRMDADELQLFFKDLGESVSREEAAKWMAAADKDKSGYIEFNELVEATLRYMLARYENEKHGNAFVSMQRVVVEQQHSLAIPPAEDDEDEEEEEIPEDLAHLSIADQQKKIKIRSAYMMFLGTALVLLFSDPMVDVLSEVGARTGIPAFYVSFVVAPLASNASELIAAFNYAQKKTSKTISISISALLGAACMNNTFCLGIFAALMSFKSGGLVWEFTAETFSILFVELAIGFIAMKKTQRLLDALIVLLLYPTSIFLVFFLENVLGLD